MPILIRLRSAPSATSWEASWNYWAGPHRPIPQRPHRLAFYDRVLVHRGGQWWLEQWPVWSTWHARSNGETSSSQGFLTPALDSRARPGGRLNLLPVLCVWALRPWADTRTRLLHGLGGERVSVGRRRGAGLARPPICNCRQTPRRGTPTPSRSSSRRCWPTGPAPDNASRPTPAFRWGRSDHRCPRGGRPGRVAAPPSDRTGDPTIPGSHRPPPSQGRVAPPAFGSSGCG